MSLEKLMELEVTTLSRIEERRDDAPGSIYVYPRAIIKARGITSLGELLRTVPGFTVFHRDLQYVAGVRGLNANENEKITLQINSQEVNGVYEPDFLNGPINLDNVERVEVVVGPSSFFQRANTLAATVNIITRKTDEGELVFSSGNEKPYSATLMAGKRWDPDKRFNFSITTEEKRGFDAWASGYRPNLAGTKDTGRLNRGNFFSVVTGEWGEWSGQFVAYKTELPELLINNGSPLNDGTYKDELYSFQLKNDHEINQDLDSFFRASMSFKQFARDELDGVPVPDSAAELAVAQRDYEAEMGLRYSGLENHRIQTGVQGAFEDNYDCWFTWNASTPPSFSEKTTLFDQDTGAIGLYVSDNYKINDQLNLINGIRYDLNTILDHDGYAGGHSGLIYKVTDHWTSKLIYNRTVRFPVPLAALNEVWGKGKEGPAWTRHFPNADRPEILSTIELQNIYYFTSGRLGVTAYYQQLDDFISWSEPHSNVGDFKGWGIENDLLYTLTPQVNFWANSALNNSKLSPFNMPRTVGSTAEQHHALINADRQIVGSAKVTANMGFDWNIYNNVVFTSTVRYFTGQVAHDFDENKFREIDNRYYLDASMLWEKIGGKNFDLRLSGMNILNNRQEVGGQWLGDTYKPRGATFLLSAYLWF